MDKEIQAKLENRLDIIRIGIKDLVNEIKKLETELQNMQMLIELTNFPNKEDKCKKKKV